MTREEEAELTSKMQELAEAFTLSGYDIVATGPHEASLWQKRIGLLRKVKGLIMELDAHDWKKLSDYFDKGNFTLGNIFGFSRGEQKFFIVLTVDNKKKIAIIYSVHMHNETYDKIRRYRPLLVVFKNKKTNKMFASFVNDSSWSKKLETQRFPDELFLVEKTFKKSAADDI